MSILVANATDTFVPQGSDKELRMEILTEEGNAYNLTGHTVYMVLSSSRTGLTPVLQKIGTVVIAANGTVIFEFTEDDTKDLLSIAYSADVWVVDDATDEKWPAWSGRIGVVAVVPLLEEVVL